MIWYNNSKSNYPSLYKPLLNTMSDWWNNPSTKHAYWLSLVSVVITLIAAGGGIAIYFVSHSLLALRYITTT